MGARQQDHRVGVVKKANRFATSLNVNKVEIIDDVNNKTLSLGEVLSEFERRLKSLESFAERKKNTVDR